MTEQPDIIGHISGEAGEARKMPRDFYGLLNFLMSLSPHNKQRGVEALYNYDYSIGIYKTIL